MRVLAAGTEMSPCSRGYRNAAREALRAVMMCSTTQAWSRGLGRLRDGGGRPGASAEQG